MRRKAFRLSVIEPRIGHTSSLDRLYQRIVRAWWNAARDQIMPEYRRALEQAAAREASALVLDDISDIGNAFRSLGDRLEAVILEVMPELRLWIATYEAFHRSRFSASLIPTGVNLGTMLGPDDVSETLGGALERNVGLIRNISDEARHRIEGIVYRGFTNRTPAAQVAREISEAVGMSRARARRIAADQAVKLSSDLDTARFKQAGIDHWRWRHSGKVHFRPEHKARDGKIYTWENAPKDLPGQLPYCGCKKQAEIVLE